MSPPLIVTRDETLLDDLLRLAAAAGVTPETAGDGGAALRVWASPSMVLVGGDLVGEVALVAPPRRDGVVVVCRGEAPEAAFRAALAVGAESVAELPAAEDWVVASLTDLGDTGGERGLVVGVTAGSGGAGATTLACALGQVAARSGPAAVIDLDPFGPGCDRVLGLEGEDGVRWGDLVATSGRFGGGSFRATLPRRDGPGVLTWSESERVGLPPAILRETLSAAARGHRTVVIDLPRVRAPMVDDALGRCDRIVLVTVPTVAGVASAVRVVDGLPPDRVVVTVRGRGVPEDDIARVTGCPVVVSMADQRGLAESIDLGLGPLRSRRGPLASASRVLLQELAA